MTNVQPILPKNFTHAALRVLREHDIQNAKIIVGLLTPVLLICKWMGLLLRKNHQLECVSYINSIAKTAFKKIGSLIRFMKSLSPEVALYLNKSTRRQCMEYCCHVWAGVPSCYLELLDKLQKRICRTVGPSLAACLEPLAHRWNVASLSHFYRYYFGLLNWLNWFHFLLLSGVLLIVLIDCMIFVSPFVDVSRMSMSTVPFLAQFVSGILCLWNALSGLVALSLELTDIF